MENEKTLAPVFITRKQAAQLINASEQTIERYCIEGKLPYFSPSPRVIRVRYKDVISMMEDHKVPSMADYVAGVAK